MLPEACLLLTGLVAAYAEARVRRHEKREKIDRRESDSAERP